MVSWNLGTFRNDLSIFIKLIEDEEVTGDFSGLKSILDILDSKTLIEYKLENLCFFISGSVAGAKPDNLTYFQIYLDNMLMAKETLDPSLDPLYCYSLDINIHAFKSKSSTAKSYCSSWHLDKHKSGDTTKYTHPTYHFQFGGKKMELIDEELSVLSCPRIPHPPMDIFLGFHFILGNFFNNKKYGFVNSLLGNYEYQQIIKRAQERLWTPYFGSYNSSNTHNDFTFKNVFPLYIN